MEMSPRRFKQLLVLAVVAAIALYPLFEAAGKRVAAGVAIATLAVLVAVYLWTGLLMVRAVRDQRARELLKRRGYAPASAMIATPLILIAAHPWGAATLVVGAGAMVGCQFFLHATIVVVAIRGRRAGAS
jgi:hypothetical protein